MNSNIAVVDHIIDDQTLFCVSVDTLEGIQLSANREYIEILKQVNGISGEEPLIVKYDPELLVIKTNEDVREF